MKGPLIHRALRIGSRIVQSTVGSVLFVDSNKKLAEDNSNLFWDDTNNIFSVGGKCGMTSIGGFAVKLTNQTGSNSVQGQLIKADTASDDAIILTGALDDECFGVFLDSGVANGSEAWVVVAGIVDIAMEDDTAATHGNWVTVSSEAGYANATSLAPVPARHFEEVGHCIETVAAGGAGTHILARCVVHFN